MKEDQHRVDKTWAILVANRPGKSSAGRLDSEARLKEARQLMSRAKIVATPERICVLIEPQYWSEWRELAPDIPAHNLRSDAANTAPLESLRLALRAIRARETNASVILIPADHCAAIESAWISSARGAVALAAHHHDTVYLLHDHVGTATGDFQAHNDLCSTTVVVGTTESLVALCEGSRTTKILDLMTESDGEKSGGPLNEETTASPINIIHVRSIEEYGRIQTGRYSKLASHIDVSA